MRATAAGSIDHQKSDAAVSAGSCPQPDGPQHAPPGGGKIARPGMILIGGWLPKMAAKSKIKKKSVKRMTWTWVTILFLFITELLFYTYCRVQSVQMGIAISSERRKQEELIALQNSLKIELARLKAPERISVIARKNLGLGMPDPAQIILVP